MRRVYQGVSRHGPHRGWQLFKTKAIKVISALIAGHSISLPRRKSNRRTKLRRAGTTFGIHKKAVPTRAGRGSIVGT